MTLDAFAVKIKNSVSDYLDGQISLQIRKIRKNNGVELCGMIFGSDGSSAAPTIYLDDIYKAYEEGTPLGSLVRQICAAYEESCKRQICVNFFEDYSKVKTRLSCRLVNYERNRELLKEIPHTRFLDLAIIYSCLMFNEMMGNASIIIRNEHMEMWGVNKVQVHENAMRNMCRVAPVDIFPLDNMVEEHIKDSLRETMEPVIREQEPNQEDVYYEEVLDNLCGFLMQSTQRRKEHFPIFVLTNSHRNYGAASILYSDMLKRYADTLECNLFLLPSSVHEIIFFPDKDFGTKMRIQEMVREVNGSYVPVEDYLSDTVYYFDRVTEEITIYKNGE